MRFECPMKFPIKNISDGGIIIYEKSNELLLKIGDISLSKNDMENNSYYTQDNSIFHYYGFDKPFSQNIINSDGKY